MTKQSILTGKCAEALLKNLQECGFSDSLTYRARAHAVNNQMVAEAVGMMRATIAVHGQHGMTEHAAELRLRTNAIGKVRSKDAMSWQIDDLLNFLQGWVRAGQLTAEREAEEAAAALVQVEVTEQPTPTPAKPCPTLGAECRGCPDCGPVMGDATYQEMELAAEETRATIAKLDEKIIELGREIDVASACYMAQFIPVAPLCAHTYSFFASAWDPTPSFMHVDGYTSKSALEYVMPEGATAMTRLEAVNGQIEGLKKEVAALLASLGEAQ